MPLTAVERRHVRALLNGEAVGASQSVAADSTTHADGTKVVVVVGAHPWAGASTVALALADAAALGEQGVLLVDAAARKSSGLVGVTDRELGVGADGCSVGRRGAVEVRRAAVPGREPAQLMSPRSQDGVVVVDAGRCVSQPGSWQELATRSLLVLVCRATIPGFRAAEVALNQFGRRDALLAAVGSGRLSGVVQASAGLRVAEVRDHHRLVCFPHHGRLDVEGLDDRPLPKALLTSAGQVWTALSGDGAPNADQR